MIKLAHLAFAALALLVVEVGYADEHKKAQVPTLNAAGGYGEVLANEAKPDGLAAALGKLDAANPAIDGVFSGRVGKVCQKQGCWMQLLDGEQMARVMTNHRFVLPKDFSGNAVVIGKLERIELSEEEAKHMAKDAGTEFDPAASRVEYRIDARGVAPGA